jgi:hypothetical protein
MKNALLKTLIAAELEYGLVTKVTQAKEKLEEKATLAFDALTGASPEAVIPEGYVLVPKTLASDKLSLLAHAIGASRSDTRAVYKLALEISGE